MAEKEDGILQRELGISRRDLLKRGAVVGGTLVWATPLIQSVGGRALANHNRYDSCCECTIPGNPQRTQCFTDHNTLEECQAACAAVSGNSGTVTFYGEGNFNCDDTDPDNERCRAQNNEVKE